MDQIKVSPFEANLQRDLNFVCVSRLRNNVSITFCGFVLLSVSNFDILLEVSPLRDPLNANFLLVPLSLRIAMALTWLKDTAETGMTLESAQIESIAAQLKLNSNADATGTAENSA